MSKPITVFHLSADASALVEVKRTARFYVARRWARQHPDAEVYVRVAAPEFPAPLWFGFAAAAGVPNAAWRRLGDAGIARLPELLESA